MILARPTELDLAFRRLGLPTPARDYVGEKLPVLQLLLTGLAKPHGQFLKSRAEAQVSPGREEFPYYVPGDQRSRPGTALLAGRKEQFDRLAAAARKEGLGELADALEKAVRPSEPPARTKVMGVINVTPDSFSDGGKFLDAGAAIARGEALAKAGADILDVGGESTRPGAAKVSADDEAARVVPVIRALRERCSGVALSVDTTKAAVARAALDAGATIVNDVSGFRFDAELPRVTAEAKAACVLMHMQGTPETMQKDPRYGDVVEEVAAFLAGSAQVAIDAGVAREKISIDPGIGFGKTLGHNLMLLRRLDELRVLGFPLVVGTSRKSFLGKLTGERPAAERLISTVASLAAIRADVVRVHDVAEAREALAVADAIRGAVEGGSLF